MDDFVLGNLQESRNEFCARLINILTPHIANGLKSIFDEAWKLCIDNDEAPKYLMTFQNFLMRVPKWNVAIIEQEAARIVERSGCGHIEELITCVHIVQLKMLTCMRAGSKQKKIDISIPKLADFIHKVYVNVARKMYSNVFLFEKNKHHLQIQKHNRQLEIIIKECILNTVRESIPIEHLLKVYMEDEFIEEDTEVVDTEEIISQDPIIEEEKEEEEQQEQEEALQEQAAAIAAEKNNDNVTKRQTITFDDIDRVRVLGSQSEQAEEFVNAPKTLERLEEISIRNFAKRKEEDESGYDDDGDTDDTLRIGDPVNLGDLDVDVFSFDS